MAYPVSVRDRVAIDYGHKLNDKDRQWLAAFNEAEYGSNPQCLEEITGKKVSLEDKRRMWREIKRYQRDLLTAGRRVDIERILMCFKRKLIFIEDSLNDMIDLTPDLERVSLELLKAYIMSKEWHVMPVT